MKVITGLTKPTSGEISLFGKKNLEDERNKIGCLIENPALYMDMTARQNLEIQRTQRGIPGKSSIDEVLEIMDLKDAGNKRVKIITTCTERIHSPLLARNYVGYQIGIRAMIH